MMQFCFNAEIRQFTWVDEAGNVWQGNKGDKSQGLAKVIEDNFTGKSKDGKSLALPKNYKGGTGTNRKVKTVDVKKQAEQLAGKDMIGKKAYQKRAKVEKASYMKSDTYKQLKDKLATHQAIRARANKAGMKKGLMIGAGAAAGAAALGAGAYAVNKAIQKKKAEKAEQKD